MVPSEPPGSSIASAGDTESGGNAASGGDVVSDADEGQPSHPPLGPMSQEEFKIAILCALKVEADQVRALFDCVWEQEKLRLGEGSCDPVSSTTGLIGRHNVVLAHLPGTGKIIAARSTASVRQSFRNIKLFLVVGVCGAVPYTPEGEAIVLGDVIISTGVVQTDFGNQRPKENFVQKHLSLEKPVFRFDSLLRKLEGRQSRKEMQSKMAQYLKAHLLKEDLGAKYPGASEDKLFVADYEHIHRGSLCKDAGCDGELLSRDRLKQPNACEPVIHFGGVASSDTVMEWAQKRDQIANANGIIAFEMEGAAVWKGADNQCLVIKGASDYADSHKNKIWQPYAAATAAACLKVFLDQLPL